MALRLPEELADRKLGPLCVATKFKEAREIEAVLDSASVDYTVETTPVASQSVFGIIFGSSREGVLFLVPEEQFGTCVDLLEKAGLSHLVIE